LTGVDKEIQTQGIKGFFERTEV